MIKNPLKPFKLGTTDLGKASNYCGNEHKAKKEEFLLLRVLVKMRQKINEKGLNLASRL